MEDEHLPNAVKFLTEPGELLRSAECEHGWYADKGVLSEPAAEPDGTPRKVASTDEVERRSRPRVALDPLEKAS
jgi:hypothetical protein